MSGGERVEKKWEYRMPGRGYDHEINRETSGPQDSPFMRPEFVLSEEPIQEPPLQRQQQQQQQHVPLNRRSCASDCSSSRHGSPFQKPGRKPGHTSRPTAEEEKNKVADLPDDVREQVRSLLADHGDPLQATNGCRSSMRPLIGEPTRLSAQPTVEEIQMCFAQIDLAILMETKPTLAPRRFTSPNHANDRKAVFPTRSSPTQHYAPASANCDRNVPEYGHRICARRAFGSPPRLVIPRGHEVSGTNSESDTSSVDIHADLMTQLYRTAPPAVSPEIDTLNAVVNEAANPPPISRMQQLLVERANMRRKSAAAAAIRNSANAQAAASRSSRASSPAAPVTLPVSPNSMQQQLIQRANMRRSLQASMSSTEGPLYDAISKRSIDNQKGQNQARAFTSPTRNSSAADKRRSSSPEQYQEAVQMTLSSVREDFLQKLQQIQELAAGGRGSPSGSKYGNIEEGGGDESSTSEKEKKRAYQNPIWTHRSCSSSSLNGGRYRTQEEDNFCLDTDVESQ